MPVAVRQVRVAVGQVPLAVCQVREDVSQVPVAVGQTPGKLSLFSAPIQGSNSFADPWIDLDFS